MSTSGKTPSKNSGKAKNDNVEKNKPEAQQFPDPFALSQALMNAYQQSKPVFMDMIERTNKELSNAAPQPMTPPIDATESTIDLMKCIATDPLKYWSMQLGYAQKQVDLLQNSMRKFSGEETDPIITPNKGDRRFRAPEWDNSALFDFIKQYYLLASEHVQRTIDSATDLPKEKKDELSFTARLMIDAISPSNFLMTNPEVLNETIRTGGDNLVKGLQNLTRDIEQSKGALKISMTDKKAFKLGENIATTKGHIVYENDLIQLIQYEPRTDKVFKKPLLIVPPWINKYYILDLREDNSYVKWAVEQGHTVFCISWVNPTKDQAMKGFEDYMLEGILAASDQIERLTGESEINAVGYCLGGTLLATTMSYLAAKKQKNRISNATFLTTLIDFENAGELKMFMGGKQLEMVEKMMKDSGYFAGRDMKQTFSLLRANDLIWSFVINNYLMGKEPFPFDLLYWNDDTTNMPAAMHSFYLKNMYRDNLLAKPGGIKMDGVKIDITDIDVPCYFLSTKEDHIAPWKATYETTQLVSGDKVFTLAASGHIAGVANGPAKKKYCYWTTAETPQEPDAWLESAVEHDGSWWPHWNEWLSTKSGEKVSARKIKDRDRIEPAPGRYVRMSGD
ncbi:MAG: class I poly(R)-hydroxyalkanoic acid synthase [Micavibrio sp.]|nr:class I poly(R)-hydroxyalkanoic acid synthase [Micavibrio sp.]